MATSNRGKATAANPSPDLNIFAYAPVVRAEYLHDFVLRLTFKDGRVREFDFEPFLTGDVFLPLRDLHEFKRFKVKYGTVVWPNGADVAPETLYHGLGPV